MAKKTYLQLANAVLRMVPLPEIPAVTSLTGTNAIVVDNINQAQLHLSNLEQWYSLYATRSFTTTLYTASTISFTDSDPDTILDSASGLGAFESGSMVLVSGSTNNSGVYEVTTATVGTLTLDSSESLTAEAAGESITITAITYGVASDHSRTIDIVDITNDLVVEEDFLRAIDSYDPDENATGNPTYYTLTGDFYKFWRIPAAVYTFRERYWKQPTTLSANGDSSDLPIEVENAIIYYSIYLTYNYLGKLEQGILAERQYKIFLKAAVEANKKKIDRIRTIQAGRLGIRRDLPRLPSSYDRRFA